MTPRTIAPLAPLAALGATALLAPLAPGGAAPSSHREAPFVTEMPKVDGTDLYAFTSYEDGRDGFVTLLANYQPLQDPYGGPNYFTMDPQAYYDIHVDTDGDAVEDLTFRFSFQNRLRDIQLPVGPPGEEILVSVPLANVGPVDAPKDADQNVIERFRAGVVTGPATAPSSPVPLIDAATGSPWFDKPLDNVGQKSIADYAAYADQFAYDVLLPDGQTGRLFVGQRDDPFVVNLGETFDLVNLNPLGAEDEAEDSLAGKSVTTFALEVPKTFLTPAGTGTIGVWTTARLPRTRTLLEEPGYYQPAAESGDFVQVSRLGMPLVNEVVVGLRDKDRFNGSEPKDDAQFLDYVTNPTLPELLEALFGVPAPELFPRTDLVSAFLTGLPGINETGSTAEMLRLNLETPPVPAALQSRLGVLGGDLAGYPNGRRPGDDVVDVSLRVLMGALIGDDLVAPVGDLPFTDGALVEAIDFDEQFPYLLSPLPGSPQ